MSETILEVKDLSKRFRVPSPELFGKAQYAQAVDRVSFTVRAGETLGLVGESGCGKSTVGRLLVGLEPPDSGSILYRGQDIVAGKGKALSAVRTDIQMVFQDAYSSLNPRKHIRDILAAPLLYHGFCTADNVDKRIDELLDMVGMPKNTKGRYPHEFSGGQRQRICIASALSLNPRFIVCDEPVSALDVSIQAQILNLLKALRKELNLSLLFIGHGLAAVKYISDDIAVMYMGQLVETAPAEELFHHPLHPYTKALLAAVPVADPEIDSFGGSILQGEVGSNTNLPEGCRFRPRCPYASARCAGHQCLTELRPGHFVACSFAAEQEAGK